VKNLGHWRRDLCLIHISGEPRFKAEMRALDIAGKIATEMQKGQYQVILSNIVIGDMVVTLVIFRRLFRQ
jgi:hypothetical protein